MQVQYYSLIPNILQTNTILLTYHEAMVLDSYLTLL